MRTTDERISAVKNRTSEFKIKQKFRKNRIIILMSVAASIVIIVGMSFAMPNIMRQTSSDKLVVMSDTGSIFSDGNAIGYGLIAIVAFCLGVCVTILCVHFHKRSKEDNHHDRNS